MPSPTSKTTYTYTHRGWKFPTLRFALDLHDDIIEASGGESGVRNVGYLESSLRAPIESAGGEDAYYRLFDKVSALGFRVARNHGFVDGNKRTAMLLMAQTLAWQGYYLTWSDDARVIVITLLGAGHLDQAGLKHALVLACGLDITDSNLE